MEISYANYCIIIQIILYFILSTTFIKFINNIYYCSTPLKTKNSGSSFDLFPLHKFSSTSYISILDNIIIIALFFNISYECIACQPLAPHHQPNYMQGV